MKKDNRSNPRVERFEALPVRAETWQGGLVRLPGDLGHQAAVWASSESMFMGETGPDGTVPPVSALDALLTFACDVVGYRPARLEVASEALAVYLGAKLAGVSIVRIRHDEALTVAAHLAG